jgi:alanine or glycine:cation symporter, AGCS family
MLALHLDHVPATFLLIVRSAFGLQPAVAGVSGGITAAMLNGVKRGLFSNEAAWAAHPTPLQPRPLPIPAIQGFIQAPGVFIDTIIICSTTAFIILAAAQHDEVIGRRSGYLSQEAMFSVETGSCLLRPRPQFFFSDATARHFWPRFGRGQ